jgi:hypothetical protein
MADVCRVWQSTKSDFLPARFCGRSRADLLRAPRFFLHLRDPREREENTENFQANEFEEYRQVLAESVGVLDHWKWWYYYCRREETRRRRNNGDF